MVITKIYDGQTALFSFTLNTCIWWLNLQSRCLLNSTCVSIHNIKEFRKLVKSILNT